jgi:ABC-type maltose transport system permease subunit
MAERVSVVRRAWWGIVDILVLVYALFPVLWILSLSLKPTSNVKDGKLIPSSVTFDNYRGIFRGDLFGPALRNSIGIGVITTAIAVVIGGMAAYAIARLDFPGRRLLIGIALLIAMFIRAAAGDLHVVRILPGDPVGLGESGQDGRCHPVSGLPQGDRPAGHTGHRHGCDPGVHLRLE